jgi:hypothetical protein
VVKIATFCGTFSPDLWTAASTITALGPLSGPFFSQHFRSRILAISNPNLVKKAILDQPAY